MAQYYFINQKIVSTENPIVLGSINCDIELEPVRLLNGAKLNPEPTYIEITLSKTGGNFFPDIISVPITLYSTKVKNILTDCGIDNIDYYPVKIISNNPQLSLEEYWFAHILGRINCLDLNNSNVKVSRIGVDFKSFTIDGSRTLGLKLFRLHECGKLVIVDELVYSLLSKVGLRGVVMKNTKDYDGYGVS